VEMLGNSEVLESRSIKLKSRSIEFFPKSIDRIIFDRSIFPRTDCCRSAPERPIRSFSMTKAVLPLIFPTEHAGFVTLVVSSKRGTLEGVRGVILHGFLTLISFYKAIAMPPC
jgi:hypothetical protein